MFGIGRNLSEDENEKRGAKPIFHESPNDNEYVKTRLAKIIRFFEKHRELNRRNEQLLQYSIIGLGTLIPIINVAGYQTLFVNILSAIFGAAIAGLTAILQFEKFHERWQDAKRTASKLKKEYYEWQNCTGEYALKDEETKKELDERVKLLIERGNKLDANQAWEKAVIDLKLSLLVKRCEEIMASEAFDYVALFSPTNEPTPK
jgi:hypothetical protein